MPDEEARVAGLIDEAKLAAWMDQNALPGAGEPLATRFITGGASNELFEIKRGDHLMALRRPPRTVPKGRNETMMREARVLSALGDTDVPHARVRGVCEDTSLLGASFYLMDFVDGWTPMGVIEAPFDADIEAKKDLGYELVDAIAKLANVDWKERGLEGFGKPEGFLDRQVDRWYAHLKNFQFREIPGLDLAGEWLRAHTPRQFCPGIIHGDYQFANVMFAHGAPARLAAIVDWEMSTIGDPLLDLAWMLMGWPNPDEEQGSMSYFDYTGMPSREELMQRYASATGLPVDEMDYYIVLARFKIAIVLEGGYARFVKGGADNPKMQAFGQVVLDQASAAAELAKRSKL